MVTSTLVKEPEEKAQSKSDYNV